MIKKLFTWLARNELAALHSQVLRLQEEVEEYRRRGRSHLEVEVTKLKDECLQLKRNLKEANKFSSLGDQLRSHALFLEKFEAQEKRRIAGLQHIILWAIDADKELKFLTQGNTKEYMKLRRKLERIFDAYDIQGLEE